MHDYYDSRENAILSCIEHARKQIEHDNKGTILEKTRNLRIFKQELEIEHISKARSLKVKLNKFYVNYIVCNIILFSGC